MRYALFIILVFSISIYAQGGKYAGDFIEQGIGVRALSLGQAYSAAAEDVSAIYYNPAGLSMIEGKEAYLQYTDLYAGLAYQHFVGYNHPLFSGWSIGAGWMRVGVDDIQKTQISPAELEALIQDNTPLYDFITGSFSNANDVFYLSIAKNNALLVDPGWLYSEMPIEIPFGVTFKYINQSLDEYSGSAIGFDLGGMIKFGMNDFFDKEWMGNFAYSFTIKDFLGTRIKWNTQSQVEDEIPMHFYHGFQYTQPLEGISSEMLFLFMYDTKYEGLANFGFEFTYDKLIAFRAGLRDDNFSLGAGLRLWMFDMDYALLPHDLGNSHRVSLMMRF